MSSRKRKYRPTSSAALEGVSSSTFQPNSDVALHPTLFVQAYEADIIRGPDSLTTARSLEVIDGRSHGTHSTNLVVGEGLIRWGGSRVVAPMRSGAVTDSASFDGDGGDGWRDEDEVIWVDRYAFSERSNRGF